MRRFFRRASGKLIGDIIGGVAMLALLNHAPLAVELEGADSQKTFREWTNRPTAR